MTSNTSLFLLNARPAPGKKRRSVWLRISLRLGCVLAFTAVQIPAVAKSRKQLPIALNHRNPHYFVYRGRSTALITSGEHYGAVINQDVNWRKYLQTIAASGFNYTRLFGGSYIEVPGKSFGIRRNDLAPQPGRLLTPWVRSNTPGYAGGGNKFDLDHWDQEYFKRLKAFLAEAQQLGIVVELTLFSSQYNEVQYNVSPFNPHNNINGISLYDWHKINTPDNGRILEYQKRYTTKMVQEAGQFPNVIFEIQNEPWSDRPVLKDVINPSLPAPARNQFPNIVELPDASAMAWQKLVAGWIVDEESARPQKHLIAQNYCNFRLPVAELIPGVSIVNFHYAYPEVVQMNYGLGKAISYDETGFIGQDDDAYVRQAWNFMLSGGSVFDNLDYSFSPGHEDGSDTAPNGPGGGSPELRRRLAILHRFLNRLPLTIMKPDSTATVSSSAIAVRALSTPRGLYAAYLDGNGPANLTLSLPAGSFQARWISTQDGKVVKVASLHSRGGSKVLTSPQFQHGIALEVEPALVRKRKRARSKARMAQRELRLSDALHATPPKAQPDSGLKGRSIDSILMDALRPQ